MVFKFHRYVSYYVIVWSNRFVIHYSEQYTKNVLPMNVNMEIRWRKLHFSCTYVLFIYNQQTILSIYYGEMAKKNWKLIFNSRQDSKRLFYWSSMFFSPDYNCALLQILYLNITSWISSWSKKDNDDHTISSFLEELHRYVFLRHNRQSYDKDVLYIPPMTYRPNSEQYA